MYRMGNLSLAVQDGEGETGSSKAKVVLNEKHNKDYQLIRRRNLEVRNFPSVFVQFLLACFY